MPSLSLSDFIAAGALLLAVAQWVKQNTVSREHSSMSERVALLESQMPMHGEQIGELRKTVGRMGDQVSEVHKQMAVVEERLASNSAIFTEKFDRILRLLESNH